MNKGIVTAGHPKTANAAAEILRAGGNAFDAAIAAIYTASVVEPALASLGGGGFLMALPKNSKPKLFDFFVQTPSKPKELHELDYRSFMCDFGSTQQEFVIGSATSAVPGCVKGIFEIAKQYSSIPMKELIQPAIDVLKEGVIVTEIQALIIDVLSPIYLNPSVRKNFESRLNPGTTAKEGEFISFPGQIDLLETLAIEGQDLFYRGEIAKSIDESSNSGGLIKYDDMVNYQVEIRTPLQVEFNHDTVFLNPPPSNGGMLIALGLTGLNSMSLGLMSPGSLKHFKALFDTFVSLDKLDQHTINEYEKTVPGLMNIYFETLQNHIRSPGGTTHISIIDRQQNAASVSVSNGEGCGTLIPGTSVMLNNMMGEEDVNPHGLKIWPRNTRLSSLMSPTIAIGKTNDLLSIGSAGSNRIPNTLMQVLVNLLQYRTPVEQAVLYPRIHVYQGEIYLENLPEYPQIAEYFRNFTNITLFPERNFYFGGVQASKRAKRSVEGCGDVRRGGVTVIVE